MLAFPASTEDSPCNQRLCHFHGNWYRWSYHSLQGSQYEQMTGLAAGELSRTISATLDGVETVGVTTYDAATKTITQTTDVPGATNNAVSQSRGGLLMRSNTPSVQVPIEYGYDAIGRLVTTREPRTGAVTTRTYHTQFSDAVESETTTTAVGNHVVQNSYDSHGFVHSREVNGTRTIYLFNARGQPTHEWGATYPVKTDYDELGRRTALYTYRTPKAEDAAWQGLTWPSDPTQGHPERESITTWTYHLGTGKVERKTDVAGNFTEHTYDATTGLIFQRKSARDIPAGGEKVTATYLHNAAGRFHSVTYNDGTPTVTVAYDANGRMNGLFDATGQRWFGYDAAGRLTMDNGVITLTNTWTEWGYDTVGRRDAFFMSDFSFAAIADDAYTYEVETARLSSITAGSSLFLEHNTTGTLDLSYDYVPNSDLTLNVKLFDSPIQTRGYDALGRLKTVQSTVNDATLREVEYGYNTKHERTTLERKEENSRWRYGYNHRGEVETAVKENKVNGAFTQAALLRNISYEYDAIGNRGRVTNKATAARDEDVVSNYEANSLNQYTERTVPAVVDVLGSAPEDANVLVKGSLETRGQTAERQGEEFGRAVPFGPPGAPANGSVPVKADVNIKAATLTTNPEDDTWMQEDRWTYLAKNPEEFAYDLDGNMTQDGRFIYKWDAENRLKQITTRADVLAVVPGLPDVTVDSVYDAFGRRITKTVTTTLAGVTTTRPYRFYYDGWNLVAERTLYFGENPLYQRYVWGLDLSGTLQGAGGVGGLLAMSVQNDAPGTGSHLVLLR